MNALRTAATRLLMTGLCVAACGQEDPTSFVFVSEPVPLCGGSSSAGACDEFEGAVVIDALADIEAEGLDVAELSARTGLQWRLSRVPKDPMHVDLLTTHGSDLENVSTFVVEVLDLEAPRDTLVSIASNDGMALWVNGQAVTRSRYARRGASRDSDVAKLDLQAGPNVIVYKVLQGDTEWRLHREWWSPTRADELLRRAIAADAYADLPIDRILSDSATTVPLKGPSVALGETPEIRFRWVTLLGEPLWESPTYTARYPPTLPLPSEFGGAAALEIEVRDPGSSEVLYVENVPLFTASAAARLAGELSDVPPSNDPVHLARLGAVRRMFGMESGTTQAGSWMRSRTLADLYRVIHDASGYHRYPGAQVWGYRMSGDEAVEPYWLAVPTDVETAAAARPLVFSVNHMTGPDFWRGRGAAPGFVIRQSTLAATFGGFGVIPRLGGSNEFAVTGVREISAITEQLADRFPVDTSRVGLLVWSYHATSALRIALDPGVSLSHALFAVPDVRMRGLDSVLDSLAMLRPGLRLQLWSGEDDDVVSPDLVEHLTMQMRAHGLEAEHIVVPYSTHLGGLLYDAESELRRTMEAPNPADGGGSSIDEAGR